MRELVAVRPPRNRADQPRALRGLERLEHHLHPAVDHLGQQRHVELLADHGRGRQHLVNGLGQPGYPLQDHLAHALGNRQLRLGAGQHPASRGSQAPAFDEVQQHLLNAKRVPVGLGVQVAGELDLVRVKLAVGRRRDHGGHVVLDQPGQRQPQTAALAAQIGQELCQRVVAPDVGVSVGADHQQPHRLVRAQQMP